MKYFSQYPVISPVSPETISFLQWWYAEDNLFRGCAKKISYSGNRGNFSIKTVFRGALLYAVDGQEKRVEPGTFLVINEGTKYDCESGGDEIVEDVCLQLTATTIQDVLGSLAASEHELLAAGGAIFCKDLPLETLSFTDAGFENLWKELATPGIPVLLREERKCRLLRYYFNVFYRERLRQFQQIRNESAATRLEILKRVHWAKDFLHSCYAYPVTLQEVAAAACLSPSHLIKKFSEVLHTTPYQYLRDLRLQKAVYLLEHTALPVEEITHSLGFESPSSFIRAFRERYKLTPLAMRKMQKQELLCLQNIPRAGSSL